ncbi:HIT family protein [Subtercola boreus]|uniref:HIT family protein n=1 Tax=Subtercola boreus TaxID=120213 RepID=A0A3E0W8N5_9MICO|nr:HIT family protein [Subtercola boreus]RFA18179.1 HIT family protein [Subtercola boreus]RFA18561.1 HIT family protein [Subtercola boreus]RFA25089.1 HIT family protein [Subtercola boreus]
MTDSNIDLPTAEPCAFCDYLSGSRPYTVLCRSDTVAVLVTREQRGIGHLLVLPTRHIPTLLETTKRERHALIDTLAAAAKLIDEAYERPGIAIWQNNGIAAHQAIPHLHFHVAGTLPSGGTEFGPVPELSIGKTDKIAERLASSGGHEICIGGEKG